MESQPQNPEFRNNPESFHPCYYVCCINSNALQIIFHHESKHYLFVCLFGLILYIPVNSYGHVRMISSPNHTFFLSKLD